MGLFRIFHSKVVAFDQCRKKYWFRYVSGLPRPEDVPTPAGIVGTAVHRALHRACESGRVEDGRAELDVYLRMPAHTLAGPGTPAHEDAFALFEAGVAAAASFPTYRAHAELDTWVPLPERGFQVFARCDRADRLAPAHWQLVDWKTGRYDDDDTTDQQLDIGHLALRVACRLPREATVTAIAWNLRTGHRRVRELTRQDAAATVERLEAIAARMQATVEFPAMPGGHCAVCEWRPQCPDARAIADGSLLDELLWDQPEGR